MPFSRVFRTAAGLVFAGFSGAAHACTVCESPTAHRVRAGIVNGGFLHTFSLVAAPFPVFALAIGLLHFGMPDLAFDTAPPASPQADDPVPLVSSTPFSAAEATP